MASGYNRLKNKIHFHWDFHSQYSLEKPRNATSQQPINKVSPNQYLPQISAFRFLVMAKRTGKASFVMVKNEVIILVQVRVMTEHVNSCEVACQGQL